MQTRKPIAIPVVSADTQQGEQSGSNCDDKSIVALMVLGDSMAPEFTEGEILVIQEGLILAAAGVPPEPIAELQAVQREVRQVVDGLGPRRCIPVADLPAQAGQARGVVRQAGVDGLERPVEEVTQERQDQPAVAEERQHRGQADERSGKPPRRRLRHAAR